VRDDRGDSFAPLRDKTLQSIVLRLFVEEFGYAGKELIARALVERLLEVLEAFWPPHERLRPGQLLWMAVACDGRKHTHAPMHELPLVPVVLDVLHDDDFRALAEGRPWPEVRRGRWGRLLRQVHAQGAVLAQSDLAALTLVSRSRVRDDLRAIYAESGELLPYRGSVQDTGATLTHKREAVRLYEQGYLETEICELLTPKHTLESVENYIQTYKNVRKLTEHRFTCSEISGILRVSERLVGAYLELLHEHHPDSVPDAPNAAPEGAGPDASSQPEPGAK
jgi:hypothetical protein